MVPIVGEEYETGEHGTDRGTDGAGAVDDRGHRGEGAGAFKLSSRAQQLTVADEGVGPFTNMPLSAMRARFMDMEYNRTRGTCRGPGWTNRRNRRRSSIAVVLVADVTLEKSSTIPPRSKMTLNSPAFAALR